MVSRSQLLNDLNDFVNAGQVEASILLEFLKYLSRETEYGPWFLAEKILLHLDRVLPSLKHYEKFQSLLIHLTRKLFASVGIEDVQHEHIFKKASRSRAINLACRFGLPECLEATSSKLNQVLRNNIQLPLNRATLIYNNGARNATEQDLDRLWARLINTSDDSERELIATSFGFIKNQMLLTKYLVKSLEEYPNDSTTMGWRTTFFVKAVANGQVSLNTCIRHLQQHLTYFVRRKRWTTLEYYILVISNNVAAKNAKIEVELHFVSIIRCSLYC